MSEPNDYLLRDAAGNIYGPAGETLILEWIRERRITADMTIGAAEGGHFAAIGGHPLFAAVFAQLPAIGSSVPAAAALSPRANAPAAATPPTCGYAITAFFFSLGGLFICPVLPSVIGLCYALRARHRIAGENADGTLRLGGRGLAKTALVLSLAGLVLGAGCLSVITLAIMAR